MYYQSATNEWYKRKSEFFFVDSLRRARLSLIQQAKQNHQLYTVFRNGRRSSWSLPKWLEETKILRILIAKNIGRDSTRSVLYHVLNNFPPH